MTWVQLDDQFPEHPKIANLSPVAFQTHVRGICYCNRLLTDGFVPVGVALLWSDEGVHELVQVKLWRELDSGGFLIHDFLQWNKSRAAVLEERRKAAERKAKSRVESQRDSRVTPLRVTLPTPAPTPSPSPRSSKAIVRAAPERFTEFWSIYPRRQAKIAAEKAYQKALALTDVDTILAAVRRYAGDPNRDPKFTALPATWLNQGRWGDEYPSDNGFADEQRQRERRRLIDLAYENLPQDVLYPGGDQLSDDAAIAAYQATLSTIARRSAGQ